MIKKLRLKFIIINMIIVTLMLGIIFGMMYQTTSRNLDRTSIQILETIVMEPGDRPDGPRGGELQEMPSEVPPDAPDGDNNGPIHLPYFSVTVDKNGTIDNVKGEYDDYIGEASLNDFVAEIIDKNQRQGILKEYNLRYICEKRSDGYTLGFVDITTEKTLLAKQITSLLVIGLLALLVFFVIIFFLSKWAVKPVEKAWQQQRQFVADASHELKTPLTVIMTDAELLQAPGCTEDERTQLSAGIISMARQMRGLVESMLDMARMDAKSAKNTKKNDVLELEAVSLSDVATNAAMVFEPVFFEKNLEFTYDIAPGITVHGDKTQLNQLVEILLDNASKYASEGATAVLKLERTNQKKCLLTVKNQGEPISEEDLANLFKRFYRADKARQMNHSYGLGLSIAESIVQAHSGRIWAESKDGYNSFFVELPAK